MQKLGLGKIKQLLQGYSVNMGMKLRSQLWPDSKLYYPQSYTCTQNTWIGPLKRHHWQIIYLHPLCVTRLTSTEFQKPPWKPDGHKLLQIGMGKDGLFSSLPLLIHWLNNYKALEICRISILLFPEQLWDLGQRRNKILYKNDHEEFQIFNSGHSTEIDHC